MRFKKAGIIIVISAAFIIGAIFGVKYLINVKKYKQDITKIEIKDIDISKIKDGVYTGEYDVNFISAKVEVKVENKKIKSITLIEHKNERGQAAEKIVNDVVQKNSIKVDTVTGATNSSKVILKSIEQALEENVR
jgi:uncharacterized protein with FMN-binding domain